MGERRGRVLKEEIWKPGPRNKTKGDLGDR